MEACQLGALGVIRRAGDGDRPPIQSLESTGDVSVGLIGRMLRGWQNVTDGTGWEGADVRNTGSTSPFKRKRRLNTREYFMGQSSHDDFKAGALEMMKAFQAAVTEAPKDQQTKKLIGGVNLRLNVAKLFGAAWTATKMWIKVHAAGITGGASVLDGMELASEAFSLVATTLDAVRKTMPADAYVACVVLGSMPAGMTEVQLAAELNKLLATPTEHQFPWYLGLTTKRLAEAKKSMSALNAMPNLIIYLMKERWVAKYGQNLKFTERNREWGLSG